ncbi:MAG: flagellar hook-basal body protein [Firmicutes bacterium]|nr:flagellar hook-basal body protein [Alicyclobacillaceae bacterium]MCL6497312.1 flagellar hook-basal body protein [Bacillota bacterium]
MDQVLSIAASGLGAENGVLGAVATNIANLNTPGFGERVTEITSGVNQVLRAANSPYAGQVIAPGLALTAGATLAEDIPRFGQSVVPSSIPTHLAIEGPGFFMVTNAQGAVWLTRAGEFTLDANGELVLPGGYRLYPPVAIPTGMSFTVRGDGTVVVNGQAVGQIQLAMVANPAGLLQVAPNLYQATAASGPAVATAPGQGGAGTLQAGALDASGVHLADAFGQLIAATTAYQLNAKMVTAASRLDAALTNLQV